MPKILLTSAGFQNKRIEEKFLELVGIPSGKIKALFIPTAAITEEQKLFVPKCKNDLLNAGVLEQNIFSYDLDRKMSPDEICGFHAIYVCGGTTQYLLDKMNEVEFQTRLKAFFDHGGVYIGVSAGSIVMAENYTKSLGYIHCTLHVHVHHGAPCGRVETSHCPDVQLTDNQAILIADQDISIIE